LMFFCGVFLGVGGWGGVGGFFCGCCGVWGGGAGNEISLFTHVV